MQLVTVALHLPPSRATMDLVRTIGNFRGLTMFRLPYRCLALTAFLGLAAAGTHKVVSAQDKKSDTITLPSPAQITKVEVHPTTVTLHGQDDSHQLIITGHVGDGRLQDLTGDVKYDVEDPQVARITSAGHIVPLANGSTKITARYGNHTAAATVTATAMDVNLPINFGNQIVPLFTKLGCNSGGCHGKSGGQNGFALSLLGFVPEMDYAALVKEGRGRRLMPASPENSLLLLKATGSVAHAGGKRIDTGSDDYKLIKRWIAAGAPLGKPTDPVVTKISVFPEHRVVARNNRQQFAVLAHYSDGSTHDVTHRTQYETNEPDVAVVDGAALVRTLDLSGEAAVMARYQGQVAVFRATVPSGLKVPIYQFPEETIVDKYTHQQWQELAIMPSDLCTDYEFLRRVSIDLTGTLPTPTQVKAFLADNNPEKRDKLIDRLLETPEYSYYFANKWADVLKVRRAKNPARAFGTFAFHTWIRESIAADKPYDEFAREILTAIGDESKVPPTVWYKDILTPEQFVDDVSQVFLGTRIACAQCHHHPYEKWSQDDYYSMAAFFSRVGRKVQQQPGVVVQGQQNQRTLIFNKPAGTVKNKRTNKDAVIRPLDGEVVNLKPGDDPRHKLVDWMISKDNPFFARAVANRYWAHFFGRGLVDPVDDMRVTNPPSNPDLLNALAKELTDHNYSLKHLIKVIVKSRTYQLSSTPNEWNHHDKKSYARFYPRRMSAEVLYDAVSQVTDSPAAFPGLPNDKHAPTRAIMLPDESYASYFLDLFGRPQRLSACECERVTEANLAQVLHLLNSDEIQKKLMRRGGRADNLAADLRPNAEKVEEIFLWALGRPPTPAQMKLAMNVLQRNVGREWLAYEDIIWSLLNTKEFVFVR
jgi:hypothetical protein